MCEDSARHDRRHQGKALYLSCRRQPSARWMETTLRDKDSQETSFFSIGFMDILI
jgi:hypothetical protein